MNQNEIERSLRIIGQLLCENVALREENETLRNVVKQLHERVNAAEEGAVEEDGN